MSTQNAASWGYFLTESEQWEIEVLTEAGFPVHLLPSKVLPAGKIAGTLISSWFGIQAGAEVGK